MHKVQLVNTFNSAKYSYRSSLLLLLVAPIETADDSTFDI